MPRMIIDCRKFPSESGCSLSIEGTEEEVLTVAVRHAIEEHGHEDTPDLRDDLRELLEEA